MELVGVQDSLSKIKELTEFEILMRSKIFHFSKFLTLAVIQKAEDISLVGKNFKIGDSWTLNFIMSSNT